VLPDAQNSTFFFSDKLFWEQNPPFWGILGGVGAPTTKAAAAELSNTYLLTLTKQNIMQFGL